MLRHMEVYVKAYGNVLFCLNIWIYIKSYMYVYVKALWKCKKKCVKNGYVYLHIYMSFHDKVKDLNAFINVF